MSGTSSIGIEALTELARNLDWSWHRGTDESGDVQMKTS